jgi:hypothetical protein
MMLEGAAHDTNNKPNPPKDTSPPPQSTSWNWFMTDVPSAQEIIYEFLLDVVKRWPPEETLLEFKRLFIYNVDSLSKPAMQALERIIQSGNEPDFRNTLKRCCYILVNNWDATRHYKPIQALVQALAEAADTHYAPTPTLKRLRQWLINFIKSQDYEDLRLFAARYEDQGRGPWSSRYTSYLLVPQYIDLGNPIEQREAARALSKQLKDRFKFDLAMYIAKSQIAMPEKQVPKNPTTLGDEALRLIKTIVAKRGPFSYASLANIFISQIKYSCYEEFKQCLKSYLVFSIESREFADVLRASLGERLDPLYADYNSRFISDALILRTCNRAIEYLTTENQAGPSHLFSLLLTQGNPMTLVVALLKIVLICPYSRTHLEARIADLIRYYQNYPEDQCEWIVNFLEIFNVTFAIHAENVQYNLIKMSEDDDPTVSQSQIFDPDDYRIFSQLKRIAPETDLFPDMVNPETLLDQADPMVSTAYSTDEDRLSSPGSPQSR